MSDKVPPSEMPDSSLEKVRELLIGRDDKFVQEKLQRDAKGIVTNVVSEALFDRETKDGSVNKVLVPLVEKSLHRSIEANSEKIVGTLYPLVGTLVRKAVSSFLVEFVERTNALIENSFSPKSVSWRLESDIPNTLHRKSINIKFSNFLSYIEKPAPYCIVFHLIQKKKKMPT